MLMPHGTVVALVDGRRFELYRNDGTETAPTLSHMTPPHLDEQNRNAGARHFSSAGNPARYQLDEDAHAAAVAEWLCRQVQDHKMERLVIVAAPRTLGEMRRRYNKSLEEALLGEVHSDLIGRSPVEIVQALHG